MKILLDRDGHLRKELHGSLTSPTYFLQLYRDGRVAESGRVLYIGSPTENKLDLVRQRI